MRCPDCAGESLVAFSCKDRSFCPSCTARRAADTAAQALDLTPTPRTVGLGSLCVPDPTLKKRDGKQTVHFEFFHRWHRHALARRPQDLRSRPDPILFLGVEEPLAHDPELRAELEARPQVLLLFKGVPSERKIRAILERFGK